MLVEFWDIFGVQTFDNCSYQMDGFNGHITLILPDTRASLEYFNNWLESCRASSEHILNRREMYFDFDGETFTPRFRNCIITSYETFETFSDGRTIRQVKVNIDYETISPRFRRDYINTSGEFSDSLKMNPFVTEYSSNLTVTESFKTMLNEMVE